MEQKLLFFDIDGTLITEGTGKIPESTKKAIKMAKEEGHLLFVNTGRTRTSLPEKITSLNFDGYVCGCGSQIYMHDQLLFSSTIPHELCRKTIAVLRECRVAAFFEQPSGILYDGDSPVSCMDVEHLKDRVKAVDLCRFPRRQAESFTFDKFLAFLQEDTLEEKFRAFCEEHFRYFDHGRRIWEVTQKSCSKATGNYCPREQQNSFHIEHKEQDGEQVVTHFKLNHAVTSCRNTTLISLSFLRSVRSRTDCCSQRQTDNNQCQT